MFGFYFSSILNFQISRLSSLVFNPALRSFPPCGSAERASPLCSRSAASVRLSSLVSRLSSLVSRPSSLVPRLSSLVSRPSSIPALRTNQSRQRR